MIVFSAPPARPARSWIAIAISLLLPLAGGCASDEGATRPDPREGSGEGADEAPAREAATVEVVDPHSRGNPGEVKVTHVALDLEADFEARELRGAATLDVDRAEGAETLVLDTKGLIVEDVSDLKGGALDYAFTDDDPLLGQGLRVKLFPETEAVTVRYRTRPEAAALQWLPPELTAGGEDPFLFTQGQAILTRTWVPLQDSPGVRVTYDARVVVPEGLEAVMSAERLTPVAEEGPSGEPAGEGKRAFRFAMKQAIPPYLLALAVGDLAFRELGPRTGVWAEPAVVEEAAHEFADVEEMMETVEALYGPYRWGRYDILVLPPSFPFGGMENPRLTFLSPTVIAGDRSLVSVVAHELAHSWSGNLVTNAAWADFWLNEGFTTYIENRILEEVYGKERAKLVESLGRRDFLHEVKTVGADHPGTKLHQDLVGQDPDEAITSTPYDKGMAFLRMLEDELGRERFDAFLKRYFEEHAFETMTTERFLAELREEMVQGDADLEERLRLEEWLYEPGLPENLPAVDSATLTALEEAAASFAGGASLDEVAPAKGGEDAWSSLEWVIFLRALPRELSEEQIAALDERLGAGETGNSEIRFEWLKLVVANEYVPGVPSLEAFLTSQGRRRLVRPLYRGLAKSEWGRPVAERIYAKARERYHPLTRETIDAIMEKAEG